jgi:hypothetical protein
VKWFGRCKERLANVRNYRILVYKIADYCVFHRLHTAGVRLSENFEQRNVTNARTTGANPSAGVFRAEDVVQLEGGFDVNLRFLEFEIYAKYAVGCAVKTRRKPRHINNV